VKIANDLLIAINEEFRVIRPGLTFLPCEISPKFSSSFAFLTHPRFAQRLEEVPYV